MSKLTMSSTIQLETRGLCKYFRTGPDEVRALQDVSVTIAQGSFTVLTGRSGAGKTTLLALLGALERPTAGQVLFQGRELSKLSDVELARVRRRMGFVFQNFSLIPGLPVWENITYPLVPRGVRSGDRRSIAQDFLARFGMADKFHMRPDELSGGEQQRVAVARALAGQPEVLFADEPVSNLDQESGRGVLSLLEEARASGKTVVVSGHDPALISLASDVIELRAGKTKGSNDSCDQRADR